MEAFRKSLIEDGDEELVKFLESIDKEFEKFLESIDKKFEKLEPMETQRIKKTLGEE